MPADDFTDPAVTAISSHLDSMIVLSRSMAAEGMYPAVDPLSSSSILLDPTIVGEEHYRIAEEVREAIAHYKELQDIISLLGIEELSAQDRLIVARARRLQRFLTQPFAVTEAFTGKPGRSVPLVETLKGCRHNPRRHLRPVGGEFALHGRHDRRGARQGSSPANRESKVVMRLLITTPTAVVIDEQDVVAVRAEDESGSFGILNGHADFLDGT